MGETAEERGRRLIHEYHNSSSVYGGYEMSERSDMIWYEQMLDDTIREMIDEVCDEPKVGLVKKYGKGSFKFV